MTNYREKSNQPIVEGIEPNVMSDLVIDIRFCKLFRGLAFIPGLYCFLCILWNCQIQPVHASSERLSTCSMERIVQNVRSLVPVDYAVKVVCIAAHYLRCIRAWFWFHDRVCRNCQGQRCG